MIFFGLSCNPAKTAVTCSIRTSREHTTLHDTHHTLMKRLRLGHQLRSLATKVPSQGPKMEEIVSLCKRRGFIYPSSEIYNSISGFFDFGHLGVELKNNLKQNWWKENVYRRSDIIGVDASIISSPEVWKASGHVDGFCDPLLDCKESKMRIRADHAYWSKVETVSKQHVGYICLMDGNQQSSGPVTPASAMKAAKTLAKKMNISEAISQPELFDLTQVPPEVLPLLPSPITGTVGVLTAPREFNLMFRTSVGAVSTDDDGLTYLRPETAQGIFTNFLNVQRSSRMKIPFGIAQIGKAFRNEITPRHFLFRSREFEQMEIEYFISPEEHIWPEAQEKWVADSWSWLVRIGLKEEWLRRKVHTRESGLAHYAKACTDIEFQYPFGFQELMGISARGSFDLDQHSLHSGKPLEYAAVENGVPLKFVPHTIEPSIGLDRLMLAVLVSAYREDVIDGEKRVYLALHPAIAPVKATVMPLLKNNPEIMRTAEEVLLALKSSGRYFCDMDTSGAIGRRYRRADEIGTPFCLTVDFDSLSDRHVTIRSRDDCRQRRIPIEGIGAAISSLIDTL